MKWSGPRIEIYRSFFGAPVLMLRTRQGVPDFVRRFSSVRTCTDTPPCGGGNGPTNRSFIMRLCTAPYSIVPLILHKDVRWLASFAREQTVCGLFLFRRD